MQSDIVLSSRVRLARNYADLPFDLASEPEQAETCILRTLSALRQAGLEEQYDLLRLRVNGRSIMGYSSKRKKDRWCTCEFRLSCVTVRTE